MNDCIFCKIAAGQMPCYKIYENEYVLAFLDIAKNAEGHTLVIPKKHSDNIFDTDEKQVVELAKAVRIISKHFVQNCGFSGINTLNASGKDAQQSVPHYHIHIIPRKASDGLKAWALEENFNFDFEEIYKKLTMIPSK